MLLLLSADFFLSILTVSKNSFMNVKRFGSRSGPTFCLSWSGSKLFATTKVATSKETFSRCCLLSYLLAYISNNMDPDQNAPFGIVWSGFAVITFMNKNRQKRIWKYAAGKAQTSMRIRAFWSARLLFAVRKVYVICLIVAHLHLDKQWYNYFMSPISLDIS